MTYCLIRPAAEAAAAAAPLSLKHINNSHKRRLQVLRAQRSCSDDEGT